MKGMRNKLRAFVQKKGICVSQLARDSETSYLKLLRMMREYDRPSKEEADRIAAVLGVKPEEIFDMASLPHARRQQ